MKNKVTILLWGLVITWMMVIFCFSNQPATESQGTSDSVIHVALNIAEKIVKIQLSKDTKNTITENVSFVVRKLAHFTVYLILGLLVSLLCSRYSLPFKQLLLLSILICILYACTDEFHQLFVLGRSGELRDVCIDSLGSSIGILFISVFYRKKKVL